MTTESLGSKPSTTGIAANTSSGVCAVSVVGPDAGVAGVVMSSTLPSRADGDATRAARLWTTCRAGPAVHVRWTAEAAAPLLSLSPDRGRRRRTVRCRRARPRLGPPPGPGRLLRGGGATRQAVAARQAGGGRGRRGPWGGRDRLLRGTQVRRPFGDVDARGTVAVSAR